MTPKQATKARQRKKSDENAVSNKDDKPETDSRTDKNENRQNTEKDAADADATAPESSKNRDNVEVNFNDL